MRWICLALSVVISTTNASWVLAEDKPKDFVEFREFNVSDRPQVIAPPAAQEEAERLVRSLASACNSGAFMAFMEHFTPSHARRIRGQMEEKFIAHEPKMDIRQVTLLSESEDRICFGVRYAWHDGGKPEEIMASKVTARRIDGHWRIDGETVKAVSMANSSAQASNQGRGEIIPAAWNPFDPPADMINPNLEHLRGDIGIQPGLGCANGRCGR